MNLLTIGILMHYHCSPGDYRDGDFSAPAVQEALDWCERSGLLDRTHGGEETFTATKRCAAFLAKLQETPLPQPMWGYP